MAPGSGWGVLKSEEEVLNHRVVPPDLLHSAFPSVMSKIQRPEPGLGMRGGLGYSPAKGRHRVWGKVRHSLADRKSTRLNSSHLKLSRMPSSA